jgi:predicted XRE-type DNA-binding protein
MMSSTKKRQKTPDAEPVVHSSGNVFADLDVENPDAELAKAQLAYAIRERIQAMGLTQTAAAELLETDQSKVSNIMGGKLKGFTYDRLLRYLNALQVNVRIIIEPTRSHERGDTLVFSA